MTSEDVRRHNLGLVLAQLAERPLSRSDISRATGLVRGSITSLSAELIDAGIVRTADVIPAAGRGRPSTLLELSADDVATVTAMLDSAHAVVAVSSLSGADTTRIGRAHGGTLGDPGSVIDVLAAVLDEALTTAGAAGRTRIDLAVVIWAEVTGTPPRVAAFPDLEWGETDLIEMLTDRIPRLKGFPIALVPATAVAALEERASRGLPDDFLYLQIDGGIDGVSFVNGRPVLGIDRPGSLIAHLPVDPAGTVCSCGGTGCLVTVAGAEALIAASGLTALALDEGQEAALDTFVAAVLDGVPRAVQTWKDARASLARAVQMLAIAGGPSDVIIGGVLAPLAADLGEVLRTQWPAASGEEAPTVSGSELGADAALRGAERAARARVIELLIG